MNAREYEIKVEKKIKKAILDCYKMINDIDNLYWNYYFDFSESIENSIASIYDLILEFKEGLEKGEHRNPGMIEFRCSLFKNEIKKIKNKIYAKIKNNSKQ